MESLAPVLNLYISDRAAVVRAGRPWRQTAQPAWPVRRRLSTARAIIASAAASASRPKSDRVGIGGGRSATDDEARRVGGARGSRIVGLRRRLVGAVAVGVVGDRALVRDRARAPALMVAVMVIVTEPPAGMAPFQVTVLVPTVGHRGAAGGGGGDQRELRRQDVGEFVARVVGLGSGAAVGERDRVGHRAARR